MFPTVFIIVLFFHSFEKNEKVATHYNTKVEVKKINKYKQVYSATCTNVKYS